MPKTHFPRLVIAGLILVAACKGSDPGDPAIGPPSKIVVVQGNNQSALANTDIALPILVSVQDAAGHGLPGHTVTFSVFGGGGSIIGASFTGTSDASGTVTAPGWKLGKLALPQVMRASLGSITGDINATVSTQYNIVVRYFGDPMSTTNQQYFENAAARLEGIITGDVIDAAAVTNLAQDCAGAGQPPVTGLPTNLNETVDDIVIYASISPIDGPNGTLAQATPCIGRGTPIMVAYGYMKFDAADFANIGNPQEVITHEMLHILGSGTIWENDRTLISGKGGADPRFTGPLARAACAALGATVTCASSVPLENTGGAGTRDFHWRELTFNNELMTGFYNSGINPLSSMTIASMADLGFTVNNADLDAYTFVGTTLMSGVPLSPEWEQVGLIKGKLGADGKVARILK